MRIPLLIGLLALTAACGQKGNLYLPEDDPYAPGATVEQNCRSRTCKPVEAAPDNVVPATAVPDGNAATTEPAAGSESTATSPEQPATITLEPQPQEPSQQAPSQETTQ